MKLSLYITEKQFNSFTPVEADASLKSVDDFEGCDINIELFVVVLMLSRDSLNELKTAATKTVYPKVAFYHRGNCIDAVFYELATDEHQFEYAACVISDFLGAL